jgi:membrane carboxypeptidase/penicillin-binding protein
MQRIHDTMEYESKTFEMPESVSRKKICSETGLLANGDACPTTRSEYFAKKTGPTKTCTEHIKEQVEDTELDDDSSDDKEKNP